MTRLVILPDKADASHVRRSGLYTAAAEGHAGLLGNGNYQSQIRGAAADTRRKSSVFQDTVIPRQRQFDGWTGVYSHITCSSRMGQLLSERRARCMRMSAYWSPYDLRAITTFSRTISIGDIVAAMGTPIYTSHSACTVQHRDLQFFQLLARNCPTAPDFP